jgi:acetylglutamate kinase
MEYERHNTLDGLNKDKLKAVIESSFGKKLADGFFEDLDLNYIAIAKNPDYNEEYVGVMIVENFDYKTNSDNNNNNLNYLNKLAVIPEYKGNGVAKNLWQILIKEDPKVFWKASKDNPINVFYMKNSDGHEEYGPWIFYWKNLIPEEIPAAAEHAINKKQSLISLEKIVT